MPKDELFAVRTSHLMDGRIMHSTTLATGRPEAIRHAERIGPIDPVDRPKVRAFLEGSIMPLGQLVVCSGDHVNSWTGVATVFRISEGVM